MMRSAFFMRVLPYIGPAFRAAVLMRWFRSAKMRAQPAPCPPPPVCGILNLMPSSLTSPSPLSARLLSCDAAPFSAVRQPAVQSGPRGGILGAGRDTDTGGPGQVGLATRAKAKPKKPSQFKVLLLNDDYTPMEFVVMVLKRFFSMDLEQATRVMLHVHQRGVGVCGIFPYEIAETKVNQVMDFARENQHPLQCTLEKA